MAEGAALSALCEPTQLSFPLDGDPGFDAALASAKASIMPSRVPAAAHMDITPAFSIDALHAVQCLLCDFGLGHRPDPYETLPSQTAGALKDQPGVITTDQLESLRAPADTTSFLETLAHIALHPAATQAVALRFAPLLVDIAGRWLQRLGFDGHSFVAERSARHHSSILTTFCAIARLAEPCPVLYPHIVILLRHPSVATNVFNLLDHSIPCHALPASVNPPPTPSQRDEETDYCFGHPDLPQLLLALHRMLTCAPWLPLSPLVPNWREPPRELVACMQRHPLRGLRLLAWRCFRKWTASFGRDGQRLRVQWVYAPSTGNDSHDLVTREAPFPDMGEAQQDHIGYEVALTGSPVKNASGSTPVVETRVTAADVWILPVLERERVKRIRMMVPPRISQTVQIDVAACCPFVTDVGGVLLIRDTALCMSPSTTTPEAPTIDTVETPALVSAARGIAQCLRRRMPTLLSSLPSAGKASLLTQLHRRLCDPTTSRPIILNLADRSIDAKALVGALQSDPREPGRFTFVEGALTRALRLGRWLILEDIDCASQDVLVLVSDLAEQMHRRALSFPSDAGAYGGAGEGSIHVDAGGNFVSAAIGFMLFATRSVPSSTHATFFGSHVWSDIWLESPSRDEACEILRRRYPRILFPETLVDAWATLQGASLQLAGKQRPIGLRDLLRWSGRVHNHLRSDTPVASIAENQLLQDYVLAEAKDVFLGALPPDASVATETYKACLIRFFALQQERAAAAFSLRKLDVFYSSGTRRGQEQSYLRIGRAQLEVPSIMPNNESHLQPYAITRQSAALLEQCMVAVSTAEPLLLVGETGTGKTAAVTRLAQMIGQPLVTLNLSNDTEATDLLGGFKPLDPSLAAKSSASSLLANFLDLFGTAFSLSRNADFVMAVRHAADKRRWGRFVSLLREAIRMAADKFKRSTEHTEHSKPHKRRKVANVDEDVALRWKHFAQLLVIFAREYTANLTPRARLSFVEGPLVHAVRDGSWILLDEINLAAPETLQALALLLSSVQGSLTIAERGDIEPVRRHPNFRLFACMNPATDVGKRELPPALRACFTEIFVSPPDSSRDDLLAIVDGYLGSLAAADRRLIADVADFHLAIKAMATDGQLADGQNIPPVYSLRTLARALQFSTQTHVLYGLRRAVIEGLLMTFTMSLNEKSLMTAHQLLERHLCNGKSLTRTLAQRVTQDHHPNSVKVGSLWLSIGPVAAEPDPEYVVTPSVQRKIEALSRAVLTRKLPILLQGPTSSGKTSIIEYLARRTGHRFVRINNHEHTDIQEYLGAYLADEQTGDLVFREGLLVNALRRGDWIVLDELNLAPSDVLEALNRLLDDNRELVVSETQEIIRPHPNFMLFATQNPPSLYGGRKALSRAFRNRFLEVHFDDVPENELKTILSERCRIAPSYAERIVKTFVELRRRRQKGQIFEQGAAFATLRDLFRWGQRGAVGLHQLAIDGYMLLAERARSSEDKAAVKSVIEGVFRLSIDVEGLYDVSRLTTSDATQLIWTGSMRRLHVLVEAAYKHQEPVLLIGETGCGKTSICQHIALAHQQRLHMLNCHQGTEAADMLGGQRPLRDRMPMQQALRAEIAQALHIPLLELPEAFEHVLSLLRRSEDKIDQAKQLLDRALKVQAMFNWHDGPLVEAMRYGDIFLVDEISLAEDAVIERLNSVLEPSRTLTLAEKGGGQSDDLVVTAHDDFRIIATMNPGGDFGKKELSPALRNRFTEIWVPSISLDEELSQILRARLGSKAFCCDAILSYQLWLRTMLDAPISLTLRALLGWADFIRDVTQPPAPAYIHGGLLTFVDGLGANQSSSALVLSDVRTMRQRCHAQLIALAEQFNLAGNREIDVPHPAQDSAGDAFVIEPFSISYGPCTVEPTAFAFDAPSTRQNAMRVLRALQLDKAILLEGSPGVGKTSLVQAIAQASGHKLRRINLSDQSDLADLFGNDLPVDDGPVGEFAWRNATFLTAIENGEWVLLDEMNLAPQQVLEGLNSILDHRSEIFVPELNRSFRKHPATRIFAAQNPMRQGGSRKGLPRSFVDRFTVVHLAELAYEDLIIICRKLGPSLPSHLVDQLTQSIGLLGTLQFTVKSFGSEGSPWEINLRDVLRWQELLTCPTALEIFPESAHEHGAMLVLQRFRTARDRKLVRDTLSSVLPRHMDDLQPAYVAFDHEICQVGRTLFTRGSFVSHQRSNRVLLTSAGRTSLEAAATALSRRWLLILVGAPHSGKLASISFLASLAGQKLVSVSMSAQSDVADLLGGFQQADQFSHDAKASGRFSWRDGPLLQAMRAGNWLVIKNANLCSPAILDRLNSLCEAAGRLILYERAADLLGDPEEVIPHANFRLIMTLDPKYGELSRAMRNRGVEIYLLPEGSHASAEFDLEDPILQSLSQRMSMPLDALIQSTPSTATGLLCRLTNAISEDYRSQCAEMLSTVEHRAVTQATNEISRALVSSRHLPDQFANLQPFQLAMNPHLLRFKEAPLIRRHAQSVVILDHAVSLLHMLLSLFLWNTQPGRGDQRWYVDLLPVVQKLGHAALAELGSTLQMATRNEQMLSDLVDLANAVKYLALLCTQQRPRFSCIQQIVALLERSHTAFQHFAPVEADLKHVSKLMHVNQASLVDTIWLQFLEPTIANVSAAATFSRLCDVLESTWHVASTDMKRLCGETLSSLWHSDRYSVANRDMTIAFASDLAMAYDLLQVATTDTRLTVRALVLAYALPSQRPTHSPLLHDACVQTLWRIARSEQIGSRPADVLKAVLLEKVVTVCSGAPHRPLHSIGAWREEILSSQRCLYALIVMQLGSRRTHLFALLSYICRSLLQSVVTDNASSQGTDLAELEANPKMPQMRRLCNELDRLVHSRPHISELGSGFVYAAQLLWKAYVTDVPIDPMVRLQAQREFLSSVEKSCLDALATHAVTSMHLRGVAESIRSRTLLAALETVRSRLARAQKAPISRHSDPGELESIYTEFSGATESLFDANALESLQRSCLDGLHERCRRQADVLAASAASIWQRLESMHAGSYDDLLRPAFTALALFIIGVDIMSLSAKQASFTLSSIKASDLISDLVVFPPVQACSLMQHVALVIPSDAVPSEMSDWMSAVLPLLSLRAILVLHRDAAHVTKRDVIRSGDIWEQMYQLWSADQQVAHQAGIEAEQQYRTRFKKHFINAVDDVEREEHEFRELFPDAEGSEEDDTHAHSPNRNVPLLSTQHLGMLCQAHQEMFRCASSSRCDDVWLRLRDEVVDKILTKASPFVSETVDQTAAAYVLERLHQQHQQDLREQPATLDFYRASNVSEMKRLHEVIESLAARLDDLITDWPEQMVLRDLRARCFGVEALRFHIPLTSPLSHIEAMLPIIDDWESVASSATSLSTHRSRIVALIVQWRRLELTSWSTLLDSEIDAMELETAEWWPRLYEVVIRDPRTKGLAISVSDRDSLLQETASLLNAFVSDASVGQFGSRLQLLEAFKQHASSQFDMSPDPSDILHRVSIMLSNLYAYYQRYEANVAQALARQRADTAKEADSIIKIASWKDVNVLALRESANRSRRLLHKCIRGWRKAMQQPARDAFGDIQVVQIPANVALLFIEKPIIRKALQASVPSDSEPLRALPLTRARLLSLRSTVGEWSEHLRIKTRLIEDFASLAAQRSQSLQDETAAVSRDQTAQSKSLAARKRRAWADLLREIRRLGLNPNPSASLLASQRDLASIFLIGRQGIARRQSPDTIDALDSHLFRLLDVMPHARLVPGLHHEEVPSRELSRALGCVESCMAIALQHRRLLIDFTTSRNAIHQVLKHLNDSIINDRDTLSFAPEDAAYLEQLLLLSRQLRDTLRLLIDRAVKDRQMAGFAEADATFVQQTDQLQQSLGKDITTLASIQSQTGHACALIFADNLSTVRNCHLHLEKILVNLNELQASFQDVAYLLSPTVAWLSTQLSQLPNSLDADGDTRTDPDVLNQNLITAILVTAQGWSDLPTVETESSLLCDRDISKVSERLRKFGMSLNVSRIQTLLSRFLLALPRQTTESSRMLLLRAYAILHPYYAVVEDFLDVHAAFLRSLFCLAFVIVSITQELAEKGFGRSKDETDAQQGMPDLRSDTTDGVGMGGGGQGSRDVSNEMDSTQQLEGLANETVKDTATEDHQESSTQADRTSDDALDTEDDLEVDDFADGDAEPDDAESDEKAAETDGHQVDEEVGQNDTLDPSKVDEKFWSGDSAEKPLESGEEISGNTRANDTTHSVTATDQQDLHPDHTEAQDAQSMSPVNEDSTEHSAQEDGPLKDVDIPEGQTLEYLDDDHVDDHNDDPDDGGAVEDNVGHLSDTDTNQEDSHPPVTGTKDADERESVSTPEADQTPGQSRRETQNSGSGDHADSPANMTDQMSLAHLAGNAARQDNSAGRETVPTEEGVQQEFPVGDIEMGAHDETEYNGADGGSSSATEIGGDSLRSRVEIDSQLEKATQTFGDVDKAWRRRLDEILAAQKAEAANNSAQLDPDQGDGDYQHIDDDDVSTDQVLGPSETEKSMQQRPGLLQPTDVDRKSDTMDSHGPDPVLRPLMPFIVETGQQALPTTEEGGFVDGQSQRSDHAGMPVDAQDTIPPAQESIQGYLPHLEHAEDDGRDSVQWRDAEGHTLDAESVWRLYRSLSQRACFHLTEQLRLVLEPTRASRLQGDYRSGKRLNLKRIIPYIASDFTKDKIWLRRTRPSAREYQVLIALDDSKSMADSHSVHLAYQALALVSGALSRLEAGELSVVRFGADVETVFPFGSGPLQDETAGAEVIRRFTFSQLKTDLALLLSESLRQLQDARASSHLSFSASGLWQLMIIISDGLYQDPDKIQALLRKAFEARVMVVFVVIDSLHQRTEGDSVNDRSIMSMKSVTYVQGADGKLDMRVNRYMDNFPFDYFIVLRDVETLPGVLSGLLRQFFEKVSEH